MSFRKVFGAIICAAIVVSSCGPSSSNKESALYKLTHDDKSGDAPSDANASDQNAAATSGNSLAKAEAKFATALKDPKKVALIECMGVKVYEYPQPPGHPPSREECQKLKDGMSPPVSTASKPEQPEEYQMSNIERFEMDRSNPLKSFALAHAAAQCGLRSDEWLQPFNDAFALGSDADIKHYRLTDQEVSAANDAEQRVISDTISHTRCSDLANSPMMDKLDSVQRKLTDGYH